MLFTDKQTDRQTNATKNITSFAKDVIIMNDIMLHGSPCMVVNMSFRISMGRRKRDGGWGEKCHISHILCQSQQLTLEWCVFYNCCYRGGFKGGGEVWRFQIFPHNKIHQNQLSSDHFPDLYHHCDSIWSFLFLVAFTPNT